MEGKKRIGLVALLIIGPVLALVALDRAIVLSSGHWEWVRRNVPPQFLDPYRVEALLRTKEPGGALILGNSTAEEAFDAEALNRSFADRGLRFTKLTIGAAPALSFGMLANAIADCEPAAVILMVGPLTVNGADYRQYPYVYDVRAVPHLFTLAEVLEAPGMHLRGLIGQSHVLARHRSSMLEALKIARGWDSWERMELDQRRKAMERALAGGDPRWRRWLADSDTLDAFPNPNTRAISYLAARVQRRGGEFVLVEAPEHPVTRSRTGPKRLRRFRDYMAELAEAGGFRFVSGEDSPRFGSQDFSDMTHLDQRGREKYTEYVSGALREIL